MCSFLHVGNVLFGTDLSSVSLAAGRRSKTPRNRTEVFCPTTGFKKKSSCLIFLLLRYDYTWSTLYISLYLIPDIHVTMFVEANKKHTFLHFMLFTVNVSCNSLTFNSVSHIQTELTSSESLGHQMWMVTVALFPSAGRDPRGMDARGPVAGQRVPMAAGMPGPVPHNMGPNAPPPARPVKTTSIVFVCVCCLLVSCYLWQIIASRLPVNKIGDKMKKCLVKTKWKGLKIS